MSRRKKYRKVTGLICSWQKKTLIIVRHGRKDGEMIAADQISEIVANGIPAIDRHLPEGYAIAVHPGSAMVRTRQTIEAWEKSHDQKNPENMIWWDLDCKIFQPDLRFGSKEMFAKFGLLKESFQQTGNWLTTLEKYAPDLLGAIRNGLMEALAEIMDFLDDGEAMVMAGHTPMIEIMAQAIDPSVDASPLAELEGFIFEQEEDDDRITVRRVK